MRYYFAYGSNLSVEQMSYRCPDAVPIGTGKIKDYELLFRGSKTGSYLTIEPKKGSYVPVLVWEVSDSDERRLDRYEGYPVFYRKETLAIPVTMLSKRKTRRITGFMYVMDMSHPLGKPYEWYYEVCLEGYRRFGFDESLLETALDRSSEHPKSVLEGFEQVK